MIIKNRSCIKKCLALIAALVLVLSSTLAQAQEPVAAARAYIPKLEKVLTENIAAFWLAKSLDHELGGYMINFDVRGNPNGKTTKMIVSQARNVWLFSRMARAGYGDKRRNLAAAEHGYRFLQDKMRDLKHGGYYWEVDRSGAQKLKPRKHLYGQSFALYAFSEYYLATKRKDALDSAVQLFRVLETKSHDKRYGGYVEFFNEDWSQPPAGEASYMSVEPGIKLMNTHLHLLEAMTTFYRASKLPEARERLLELINIESNTVVRKNIGACTDKYEQDWTPRLDRDYARVSYGHDIENVWLLIDASDAAGISNNPFIDLYRTLFDYSLRYGYDAEQGGFYDSGPFNGAATNRNKVWWTQAEAVASALHMYRLTRDQKYLDVFIKTYDFIERRMVDWEHGEWHATVTPDGKVQGDKAHIWKAGYHQGRAMIECLGILKQLQ